GHGLTESTFCSDFKRNRRGVHSVESTIKQFNLDIQHREARQGTRVHHRPEAFLDGWPEFLGNSAANNGGNELEASVGFAWTNAVIDLTVLTRTTGLLLVGVAVFDIARNGFAVSHLRLTNDQLNTVGTLEDVDFNVEVQFTHTFQDGFA